MPNYITNWFVEIKQPNRLKSLVINSENEIDFNILSPMPKTLDIFSGDDGITTKIYYPYVGQAKTFEDYIDIINKQFKYNIPKLSNGDNIYEKYSKEERTKICDVYSTWNYLNYNFYGWYDWRIHNWGCKWNADHEGHLGGFLTAWSPPTEWLEKLALKCDFILLFADEDVGSNCGVVEAKNNKLKFYELDNVTDSSTVFSYCVQGIDLKYNEFYEEKDNEHNNYLYKNRFKLLEDFFKEIQCHDIYLRIVDDLKINLF